jgi:hypothetical protein
MHEAGMVESVIRKAILEWPAGGTGGQLELEIRDPTRAEAGSVAFYAGVILAELGRASTTVTVVTSEIRCALCGERAARATPVDPQCDRCGAPLPQTNGPALVCREVSRCA